MRPTPRKSVKTISVWTEVQAQETELVVHDNPTIEAEGNNTPRSPVLALEDRNRLTPRDETARRLTEVLVHNGVDGKGHVSIVGVSDSTNDKCITPRMSGATTPQQSTTSTPRFSTT